MVLREIVQALERIERNQAVILGRLGELEHKAGNTEKAEKWGPREAAQRLSGERRSSEVSETCRLRRGEGCGACDDEWLQQGIDSIMGYQVGKKRGEQG